MDRPVDRRRFVQVLSGGLAVGVAGCTSDDGEENGDDGNGGDDGEGSEGLAYAFGPDSISLIDPAEGEVVDEITDGVDAYEWSDSRITTDFEQVFAIENSLDQLVVIDTESREIVDEVAIGPDATHMYHPTDDEMWVHSDAEGTFYVVDVADHEVVETVESGLEAEGHGKLLYHEDFGSTGYATNVNDPGAPVIDLEEYDRSDFLEFEDDEGTHYKAYGPQNGLAYFEYGDETVVVDVETDEVVDTLDVAGGMYLTPDEELLGVLDGDEVHFLDVTDDGGEVVDSVAVEGGPDALRYHEGEDGIYGFTANTMNEECAVIDVDALEVVDTLDVGEIERPEDATHLHRSGVAGDDYFLTPAPADDAVAVVDMDAREGVDLVEAADVDAIQYVGDSGTGYTGQIR